MRIAIGADHGGYNLKKGIINFLKRNNYSVKDFGTFASKRCNYPPIGYKVATQVASGRFQRGILICKSGLGMTMVANKVPGIRAALLHNVGSARSSREHNDANIAVFSGKAMGKNAAEKILKVWLAAEFAGGRHRKRVTQISKIEKRIRRAR
ncbi:MAG: ribose 5-phosphate isomerase B [Candidatus Omnitrophota bacterium]